MLQCGGGNYQSAAILREFFQAETRREDEMAHIMQFGPTPVPPGSERRRGKARHVPGARQALGVGKGVGANGRPASTGILPIITANTDIASLRRGSPRASARRKNGPGSARTLQRPAGVPRYPLPYELPNHGIGFDATAAAAAPSAQRAAGFGGGVSRSPRKEEPGAVIGASARANAPKPPFGRRLVTKEFFDEVSGSGIACLCPQNFI
jgi:hypothetical protein